MLIRELVRIFFKVIMKKKEKIKHTLNQSESDIIKNLEYLINNPVATKRDVANLLEFNFKAMCIKLYSNNNDLYTQKIILKKNGKERVIYKPNNYIKPIQRNLLYVLGKKYKCKECSHGFEKNKSIKTNAQNHISKKHILKIDLEDFFPTINFKRVYGIFKSEPFNFNKEIATFLAHICIYQNSVNDSSDQGLLPQGAPTSPLIANLACRRLDNRLIKLSKKYKCIYTRYADDIYISTNLSNFPKEIFSNNKLSDEVIDIIERENGFKINIDKVKLLKKTQRQTVTGLVTNKKLNLKRNFLKNTRAMLHQWEQARNKYTLILFNENTSAKAKQSLFNKCLFKIFFSDTEFKNYNNLSEEDKLLLITKYTNLPLDDKKKYIYFKLAAELSLYDVEAKMHERFYTNMPNKPLFKNVLLGKLGYIKYIRGDEDDLYRKYWNRYCRIINSNKFKPLIIKDSQDNRLLNMINCVEEGLNVEFKEYYEKDKLLETVNSFLNSESGGQLFFGIKDETKEVVGIDSLLKGRKGEDGFRTRMISTITDAFKPKKQMNIVCKFHKLYKKTICRIEVQPYCERPLLYNKNCYYIRQNSRKVRIEVKENFLKKFIDKTNITISKRIKSILNYEKK